MKKRQIRVGLISMNTTPLAFSSHLHLVKQGVKEAVGQGAQLILFPELNLTGYGLEDAFYNPDVVNFALKSLLQVTMLAPEVVICVGLPLTWQGKLYNGVAIVYQDRVQGIVVKRHLANRGVHYEQRWFHPWPVGKRETLELFGMSVPLGDWIFEWQDLRFGVEICEDAWVSPRPSDVFSDLQVDLWLNASASHFAFTKHKIRQHLVLSASQRHHNAYAYVNLLGNESGRVIYDGAQLVAHQGQWLFEGKRLSFSELEVSCTDILFPSLLSRNSSESVVRFSPPDTHNNLPPLPRAEPENLSVHQEFLKASILGLYDYLRKSHHKGFVVSLSGGVDSAALVILIYFMVLSLVKEKGANFLSQQFSLPPAETVTELMGSLLTTIYQKTKQSSKTTEKLAADLAQAVSCQHFVWDVEDIVESYCQKVSKDVKRELSWAQDDLALQNIQARVRSPGPWLLANLKKAIFLTSSNRSEAVVGYCTMDGDTSGGLAPLAGVSKAFLREWLAWAAEGADGLCAPIPALKAIAATPPSAELRPGGDQTDEKDLMPYEVLKNFEEAFLRDHLTFLQGLERVQDAFPQISQEQLKAWAQKFWRLWRASQWKRERLAPSFHLDAFSVDPGSCLRYPIFSSGLEEDPFE